MKVLAHCYTYGNNSSSGADKMMQSLIEYLAARGEDCLVVIDDCPRPYTLNNVNVASNKTMLGEKYDWCDIVIIHLVAIHEGVTIARRFNKPVIHICHNNHIKPTNGYIVYNSNWLAKEMDLQLPSIIVHPPTKPVPVTDHFHSKYITLVNTNENKGGAMLKALATALPQYSFLGVHGGYDKNQMYMPMRNINYRAYSAAGMDYSDTRIIIVPSKMESWSLVAAEAMANGIPVICSNLPGLKENCGEAAIYATSTRDYMDAIGVLEYESVYRNFTAAGRARIILHNYNEELNNFYNFIENIVMKKYIAGTMNVNEAMLEDFSEIEKRQLNKEIEKLNKKPKKEKKEYKGLPTQK